MDDSLTHEAFVQNVNTKFHVSANDTNQVELELAEVSELKQFKAHEQFAVVFRGPLDLFMGQGMRSFDHYKLGRFELFIVPIRQDEEGYYYEAVFSRFRG
jgi:hypothetical protein